MGAIALVTASPGGPFGLEVDATQQLAASAFNASGQSLSLVGRSVVWRSSNAAVATVSAAGLVTAIAEGECDVVVAVDNVDSAAVEVSVTGAAPALTPVFFSDWATRLGTTDADLTDGSKWNTALHSDSDEIGEIIASTGLNFPTAKVLHVKGTNPNNRAGFLLPRKTGMSVPGVGDERYYRFYIRVELPDDLTDFEQHPVQDGNAAGDTNWMFKVLTPSNLDGLWRPRLHCQGGANYTFDGPTLTKGQTYRVEIQIDRLDATTFNAHIAIYDSDGDLVCSDADFASGATNLGTNPTLTFINVNNMGGLNCGSNGIGGTPPWPFTQTYQAGFAVCDNQGWIGAYGSVDGEA